MHFLMDLARSCSALGLVQYPPVLGNPASCRNRWPRVGLAKAKARQPALQMEEIQIRATGTDGKLVPVGEGQARPGTVASAGEGGGNRPLRAAPPLSSAGTRATGGRGGSTVAAAFASSESEIAAALMRKGLSEQQARQAAQLAVQRGVAEKVQALVKSDGFRNPENLSSFLRKWKLEGNEGKLQALEDAVARLQRGDVVALEGGGADVLDYTTKEAIQHKRIFGKGEKALGDDLIEGGQQLRGELGEVPPEGFKRVIDVRFDPRSSHPLKGGDRNAVRAPSPTAPSSKELTASSSPPTRAISSSTLRSPFTEPCHPW